MSVPVSIADIADAFPDFRVAFVLAENLTIAEERVDSLDRLIREREIAARAHWAGVELSRIPGVAVWRTAFKAFGVKQTRYRSSAERLMKNVLAARDLPRVNAFVDLYNAVSLQCVLPLGADDLDRVTPPLAFRVAREGDRFVDMAGGDEGWEGPGGSESPKPGEVVFADADHVLCRRWNWRQDARSVITTATTRAIVTVQANGWGEVEQGAADLAHLIERYCGGRCRIRALNVAKRHAEL
jgi:DNA/RNA-binding domain of Phe-tRNA-synthetase-like protein